MTRHSTAIASVRSGAADDIAIALIAGRLRELPEVAGTEPYVVVHDHHDVHALIQGSEPAVVPGPAEPTIATMSPQRDVAATPRELSAGCRELGIRRMQVELDLNP